MILGSDRAIWLSRNVVPHEPALRLWLRRWRGHGIEIDDIVQETYAILAAKESVSDIRDTRSYVFQTARSIILTQTRRARIVSIQAVENLERLKVASQEPNPEEQASHRDGLRRLATQIANLPDLARQALTLRIISGLSQREIGERMSISENAAQKHISKGLQYLMKYFAEGGYEAPGASTEAQDRTNEADERHTGKYGD